MQDIERKLGRKEASDFLTARGYPIRPATLAKLAVHGGGPIFERFGRRVNYTEANLLAWVASRSSGPLTSTSDAAART